MKYKYLLFDLDGMLMDTREGVYNSARHALACCGILVHDINRLKPFFGPPLRQSFKELFNFSDEKATFAIEKYRERYKVFCYEESKPFPGIEYALEMLRQRGYKLCVATSKLEESAVNMLRAFNLDGYFDFITGSNQSETISTKDQVIEECLRRFDIVDSKSEALMIGDMKYDSIGAQKAGVDSMGVYTGTAAENEHEEAGATYIAHSIDHMLELLLAM